ncbi:MAG: hypothetical protein ACD_79C01527G0003 [uncultured bacterium]|nr:MAG: hypothetical protein ACD_79C01527G0003 [uncultured bacterium]
MVTIKPFKAIRPDLKFAQAISAPPYDVVSRSESRKIIEENPQSFLQITRSDALFDDSVNQYDDSIYNKAKELFKKFQDDKILIQDPEASVYVYSQTSKTHTQNGIVCLTSVEDYIKDDIKKHEKTRSDKENDRTKHIDVVNADLEPVFLTYKSSNDVNTIIGNIMKSSAPCLDFSSNDNVNHKLWIISDKSVIEKLVSIFSRIKSLYIADGHHRAASAAKNGILRKQKNPSHTGNEPYNFFLSVMFPSDQLKILPYNRVVKDLNGLTANEFFDMIKVSFNVSELKEKNKEPVKPHSFSMYLENKWYVLTPKGALFDPKDVIASLDVSILQDHVLNKILGILDPKTDKRIDFVGGIHGTKKLEEIVDSNKMKVAFSLYPTSIESLFAIADNEMLMPPKSTWFEPKLRSGLFLYSLK